MRNKAHAKSSGSKAKQEKEVTNKNLLFFLKLTKMTDFKMT